MLSGKPEAFGIWCDSVDSWSTDRFKNGCLAYFIGGRLIWSLKSTLDVDWHMLTRLHCFNNDVENERVFDLPTKDAFSELCARAFPPMDGGAEHSDFTHLVSTESLSDDGHYFFLVESGNRAKLIYGLGDDLSSVFEVILMRGEFQSVVLDAVNRWRKNEG